MSPILVDANSEAERLVSQAEYESLAHARGAILRTNPEGEVKVKLWDLIDGTPTRPIPLTLVNGVLIRMVTYRCSRCHWTTDKPTHEAEFQTHLQTARGSLGSHENAEVATVATGYGTGYRCSGCGATHMSPGRARMHIDGIKRQYSGHANAHVLLVKRYALEPPAPSVSTNGAEGPVASQEEQMLVPRPRRRRHHKRGRAQRHAS